MQRMDTAITETAQHMGIRQTFGQKAGGRNEQETEKEAVQETIMSNFAAEVSKAFANMANQYEQPAIEQREAMVVTAEALTKRRKERCKIRQWKASRK